MVIQNTANGKIVHAEKAGVLRHGKKPVSGKKNTLEGREHNEYGKSGYCNTTYYKNVRCKRHSAHVTKARGCLV